MCDCNSGKKLNISKFKKIVHAKQLHCNADHQPIIASARKNIFSRDQEHRIDISLLEKTKKVYFWKIFMETSPALLILIIIIIIYISSRSDFIYSVLFLVFSQCFFSVLFLFFQWWIHWGVWWGCDHPPKRAQKSKPTLGVMGVKNFLT